LAADEDEHGLTLCMVQQQKEIDALKKQVAAKK
jgi:hypothetical protein